MVAVKVDLLCISYTYLDVRVFHDVKGRKALNTYQKYAITIGVIYVTRIESTQLQYDCVYVYHNTQHH